MSKGVREKERRGRGIMCEQRCEREGEKRERHHVRAKVPERRREEGEESCASKGVREKESRGRGIVCEQRCQREGEKGERGEKLTKKTHQLF